MWDYKLRLVTIRVSDQWPRLISGSWWGLSYAYNCHWLSLTLSPSLSFSISLSVSICLYLSLSLSIFLCLSIILSLCEMTPPPRYIFSGSYWGAYDGYFLIFLLILFFREVVQICRRLWHFLTHLCNKSKFYIVNTSCSYLLYLKLFWEYT